MADDSSPLWTPARAGGDIGPAVTPGDPDDSLLISAVTHEDELLKMPPEGKLDDRQVELLRRWVAMGAPGPHEVEPPSADAPTPAGAAATTDVDRARQSWAFRTPEDPPVPAVAVMCFGEASTPTTFASGPAAVRRIRPGQSASATVSLTSLCPTYLVAARAS